MPDLAHCAVVQQHFHDVEPHLHLRIPEQAQVIKRGQRQQAPLVRVHGSRRPHPILGRARFHLDEHQAIAIAEDQVNFAAVGPEIRGEELETGFLEMAAGGAERLSTRLLLDTTEASGPARDARLEAEKLERWSVPAEGELLPPRLLFLWGSFRFRGVIESLAEEWVLFDPDGTPVRGWIDLVLRR